MFIYRIELTPDDNDTFLVTCPLLPEVTSFGDSVEDAKRHVVDAIDEALAARVAAGADIPVEGNETVDLDRDSASLVRVPLQSAIKTLLHIACRSAGVSRAELARRLGWHREQVDRLFRFDHATRLDQYDAAFGALGRALDLELASAA
ncbi:MAG TPA: type II toxin-antitoxin system HicB family antitoxin [Inquilinus sp.]|nr:type II toxin-antitoxin system HicB family antitoxin [Inquilinus sp.]